MSEDSLPPLDFARLASLHFEAPRTDDFPALNLARHAGTVGGSSDARGWQCKRVCSLERH